MILWSLAYSDNFNVLDIVVAVITIIIIITLFMDYSNT